MASHAPFHLFAEQWSVGGVSSLSTSATADSGSVDGMADGVVYALFADLIQDAGQLEQLVGAGVHPGQRQVHAVALGIVQVGGNGSAPVVSTKVTSSKSMTTVCGSSPLAPALISNASPVCLKASALEKTSGDPKR